MYFFNCFTRKYQIKYKKSRNFSSYIKTKCNCSKA